MTEIVVAIFAVVYLGMILGGLPFVQLETPRGAKASRSIGGATRGPGCR